MNIGNRSLDNFVRCTLKNTLSEYHKVLAVRSLFDEKETEFLTSSSNNALQQFLDPQRHLEEEMVKIGIVVSKDNTDDKPQFIHRTFAEFFAAQLLASMLKNPCGQQREFILQNILIKSKNKVIRAFLDALLGSNEYNIKEDTLNSYGTLMKDLRLYIIPNSAYNGLQDDDGRTSLLHVAFDEKNVNIAKFLLNCLNDVEHNDTRNYLINDKYPQYYDETGLCTVVEILSTNLEQLKFIVRNGANLEARDDRGRTVLYLAVVRGLRTEVIQCLIEDLGANIYCVNNESRYTILHEAAMQGNLDVVKYLVKRHKSAFTIGFCH